MSRTVCCFVYPDIDLRRQRGSDADYAIEKAGMSPMNKYKIVTIARRHSLRSLVPLSSLRVLHSLSIIRICCSLQNSREDVVESGPACHSHKPSWAHLWCWKSDTVQVPLIELLYHRKNCRTKRFPTKQHRATFQNRSTPIQSSSRRALPYMSRVNCLSRRRHVENQEDTHEWRKKCHACLILEC